jgi:hypothetical protein
MRIAAPILLIIPLAACFGDVHQAAGTGAVYTTSCSANMKAKSGSFQADCVPPACYKGYEDVADSHIVTALGADGIPVGTRQRTCLQDLSKASDLFPPQGPQPESSAP